ncbi:hypothetical protein GOP47_0024530 [Adiantum capillus-veneris]|uniref:Uncharacterized protein n=1 Tax=Adiantum capillus-veneris TaxID=13818 RepID=A0A9D4U2B2_ADICA|nr:hypothetical protein GOP47_0024530 [Adiantum capillus-veneris]
MQIVSCVRDGPLIFSTQSEGISELSFTSILGESKLVHSFVDYAQSYEKRYSTAEEVRHRFQAFVRSLDLIEATNRRNLSYRLGLNQFADLTWEEFKRTYLASTQQNCSATSSSNDHLLRHLPIPSSKDWRDAGIISAVKNQGSCGSCWTFSTTGALEAAHAQATAKMVLLSEQQLVDCAGAYNNFGCSGGLPSQAFEYVHFNGGLNTEDAYPYTAEDGECQFNEDIIGVQVSDVVNITMGAENELKVAVGLVRPVSVAFEVVDGFSLFKSGVYTSDTCESSPESVNHAVLAVGYDVDESGMKYWIIKNSWGESWGMNGYFNMELGSNMCGIATCASYPIVQKKADRGWTKCCACKYQIILHIKISTIS